MTESWETGCKRCKEDGESGATLGLAYPYFEFRTELCSGCQQAWVEVTVKDKRFIRYREIKRLVRAVEYACPRSDLLAGKLMLLLEELDALSLEVYEFAKEWASGK